MKLYPILFEMRGKFENIRTKEMIRQYVKEKGYDIPEYILGDYIRQTFLKGKPDQSFEEIQQHLDWLGSITNWKLDSCLEISFQDLSPDTQRMMKEREFGNINPYDIPDDETRMDYQKQILVGDCNNEPVFFISTPEGYELQEGWHRTMTLFSRLPFENNEPQGTIKIKAWIGEGGEWK